MEAIDMATQRDMTAVGCNRDSICLKLGIAAERRLYIAAHVRNLDALLNADIVAHAYHSVELTDVGFGVVFLKIIVDGTGKCDPAFFDFDLHFVLWDKNILRQHLNSTFCYLFVV